LLKIIAYQQIFYALFCNNASEILGYSHYQRHMAFFSYLFVFILAANVIAGFLMFDSRTIQVATTEQIKFL